MGYKYNEEELLAASVEAVLEDGLSKLTFGRLAKRVGVADRSIVYYFPTKADLIARTVAAVGQEFQGILNEAFGDQPLPGDELLRRAWPIVTSSTADPVFGVFFELVGLGAAGIAPFDAMASAVMGSWIDWLAPRVDAPSPAEARGEALAAVAKLDGLLLLHHTCGAEAAAQAFATLLGEE